MERLALLSLHYISMWWMKRKKTKGKKRRVITPRQRMEKDMDEMSSMYVRMRDDWTCQKCGRRYDPSPAASSSSSPILKRLFDSPYYPVQKLATTSHFWSRQDKQLRWRTELLICLCIYCHQKVENKKRETVEGWNYASHMQALLGKTKFVYWEYAYDKSVAHKYTLGELEMLHHEMRKQLLNLIKSKGYDGKTAKNIKKTPISGENLQKGVGTIQG